MKKIITILFIFSFTSLYSQSGWVQQNSGVTSDLTGVSFVDTSYGWAVGLNGVIIKTTNGGNNWASEQSGITTYIMSVYFINQNTGWAVGGNGYILKTINGGITWTNPWNIGSTILRSVFFVNSNTGWACGDGANAKTTDGGISWSNQTGGENNSAFFVSALTGWEVGNGGIVNTTDGGNNWVTQPASGNFISVFFPSASIGWAVGQSGVIIKTTNGGSSWVSQISDPNNLWWSVYFTDVNTGWVVGGLNEGFKTTNGGNNWFSTIMNTSNILHSVCFVNNQTGWTVGTNGIILKTTTGGIFTPSAPTLIIPTNGSSNVSLTPLLDWNDVQYATTYRVQVSTSPNFSSNVIDVGNLTSSQYNVPSGILNPVTAYYWHANASTANSTSPWSVVWSFTTSVAPPPAPVLIAPANGSSNQPLNLSFLWNNVPSATSYRLQLSISPTFNTNRIDTIVSSTSFSLSNGILGYSTSYYWRVSSINSGQQGLWSDIWSFTTTPIAIQTISSEIPKEYKLYENYPNPFNPTTNIEFALPKNSFATLLIYDALGREVVTLVNQDLKAGTYKVDFDATNLPSGIYFYKLITETYTEAKKMILIK